MQRWTKISAVDTSTICEAVGNSQRDIVEKFVHNVFRPEEVDVPAGGSQRGPPGDGGSAHVRIPSEEILARRAI